MSDGEELDARGTDDQNGLVIVLDQGLFCSTCLSHLRIYEAEIAVL